MISFNSCEFSSRFGFLFTEQRNNIFLCNSHNIHCQCVKDLRTKLYQFLDYSTVQLPKIWIRKRTFAMWLRFRIASHKITPVYGRSFNNTAVLNGRRNNDIIFNLTIWSLKRALNCLWLTEQHRFSHCLDNFCEGLYLTKIFFTL